MASSDQQLVEQCANGNTAAFAQLVARYQTLVCSVAYSITGDFARSEDVGQDAFVAAWRESVGAKMPGPNTAREDSERPREKGKQGRAKRQKQAA